MSESNNQSKVPAERPKMVTQPLTKVSSLQEMFDHPQFIARMKASAPVGFNPDRLVRTFVQATAGSPLIRQAEPIQLLGIFTTCALIGLEPNTPLGHAYIIPFQRNKKVGREWKMVGVDLNLIIGYQGYLDLVFRTDRVSDVGAHVVFRGDEFSYSYGTDAHVRHRPTGEHGENESPTHAYMHGNLKNGGQAFEVMPWRDVLRIRDSSQAFKAALAARDRATAQNYDPPKTWTEAPWVKHVIAMGRKTAFRAGVKWLPKSIEMAAAVALDERGESRLIDFSSIADDPETFTTGEYREIDEGTEQGGGGAPDSTFNDRREPDRGGEKTQQQQAASDTPARNDRATDNDQRRDPPETDDQPTQQQDRGGYRSEPMATQDDAELFYLSDEIGEPIDGDDGATEKPVRFIELLRARWMTSNNRATLLENNADAIDAACAADPTAREFYESLDWSEAKKPDDARPATQERNKPAQASRRPWPLSMPQKGGRTDFAAAVTLFRNTLATIKGGDELREFAAAHEAMVAKLPGVTRKNIRTAIDVRAGEIGISIDLAGSAGDEDRKWLEALLANDLANINTQGEAKTHLQSGAIGRRIDEIEKQRPDLFKWFKDEVKRSLANLPA